MKTTHPRKQSGSSLVVVISVLGTLMVIVGVAAEYTWTVNRHVQRSNTMENAVAVADNCIDILFSNWRAICSKQANVHTPQTTNDFNGVNGQPAIPLPTYSQLNLPSVTNFAKRGTSINPANDEYDSDWTISNYKLLAVDAEWNALSSASSTPEPILGQISAALSTTAPTTPLVYSYMASVDVTLPALGPAGQRTVVAKVRRVFQKQQLSPWNFAIFYVDPLEIHPGPAFTVTGWVHTNSDLYTGHDTLTFADKVTYGSDWFVDFKPGETYHDGDTPAAPHYPSNLPPARDQAMQPFGLDATSIWNPTDGNPNNDSYHELIEPTVTTSSDPLAGERYWDQAGIIVQVSDNPSSTTPGFDGVNGHDLVKFYTVNPSTGVTTQITSGALYTAFSASGVITTNQPIQDNREGASVRLASLDISKLEATSGGSCTANAPCWKQAFGGIIYMYNSSATSSARRGIRLVNGEAIPLTGLTVASPNPVYIQGDFNTGPGTVPSNSTTSNDPTTPQSPGYNRPASEATLPGVRAPVSVVADAAYILSNNWNDSNAELGDPLSGRVATNTTVNTAIIAGIVPSNAYGDGSYSGGAENFPRFLESWSNKTFTYYGSMVEVYPSKQAIGEWTMSNVYDAPIRQWYFDPNFKTTPPPGSLMLYSYIKGKWSAL